MPRKNASALICIDCGIDTIAINEHYMVTKVCWRTSGMKPDGGGLCIGCLEARIGRELRPRDFSICPLNYPFHRKSDRLRKRLGSRFARKTWQDMVDLGNKIAARRPCTGKGSASTVKKKKRGSRGRQPNSRLS
jgi:hypothetical protein